MAESHQLQQLQLGRPNLLLQHIDANLNGVARAADVAAGLGKIAAAVNHNSAAAA